MPNVLILGGSGYIGLTTGQSLVSSGNYRVWGTARSPEKAKLLLQNEITPIAAETDITDPDSLSSVIIDHLIDIVVDATSTHKQGDKVLEGVKAAAKIRAANLAKEGIVGPKLGFIYTSGIWVHGSTSELVSDLSPVGSALSTGTPPRIVSWRAGQEQAILASRDVLDVAIIRPGLIYGRGSWIWTPWWEPLLKARKHGTSVVDIPADITARPSCVHITDTAAGLHAAIDRIHGNLGTWPVFDLVTETVRVQDIVDAAMSSLGLTAEVQYTGTRGDVMLEAMSTAGNSEGGRARAVLGWYPKRTEFVLNMAVYIRAWEAALA
ncbi:hypothetical protein ASPVEDRAFT_27078 [Aspergillus versicolor CBS 583.65]|uniref:NAD-dependent epimerase/dehydratase domain-containing protein n=1 Tax=Aspergillus versicolor CBS 583.65 TaxID=1036611 RepID=A0A1L9PFS7_ASPVE|nr:uncharacterized protein ASPVEDRAFT_27078 [Aspergillus versicolor CBS 583.65]OJJ00343.1 hypothetical protein ASPVEDRAFT_27078 [Aspergillus versicolor CBS 583.65]